MNRALIKSADEFARQVREAPQRKLVERLRVDPGVWHEILDRYPDLAGEVAENSELPDEIAIRLARWPTAYVRQRVAYREDLPRKAIETLLTDICDGVRASLMSNGQLTVDDLIALIDRDYPELRANPYLAQDAPYYLKFRFAVDWRDHIPASQPVRRSPFEDPQRMVDFLAAAGYDKMNPLDPTPEQGWVRACEELDDACVWLSYGGYTREAMFAALAASDGWESPEAAANSPHCPPRILAALAFDWDVVVRAAVASNPAADLPTLLYLASDDWPEPRSWARGALESRFGVTLGSRQAIQRPEPDSFPRIETPSEFFALTRSVDPIDRARAHFGRISRAVIDELDNVRSDYRDLLWNMTMPIERIRTFIESNRSSRRVEREGAWWHTSLLGRPDAALAAANEKSSGDREWAAYSMNSTEEALLLLAAPDRERIDPRSDDDELADSARRALNERFGYRFRFPGQRRTRTPRVRSARHFVALCSSDNALDREAATTQAAAHPSLWREVLEQAPELAKWVAINETIGPRLLNELAEWPDPVVRKWVSDHPRVWLKTLDRLAIDADPGVRRRAVYNARLSDQQLHHLQSDSDPEVAAEAVRRRAASEYARRLLSDPDWWRHLGNSEIS